VKKSVRRAEILLGTAYIVRSAETAGENMNEWKLPWNGACRCGQVRFTISAAPLLTMACHCRGCQKMSASAYSLSVAIPTAGFAVAQGAPVLGGLHGATRHYFCPHCKTWMFTRPEGMDDFVNVRPTLLDDASWVVPFIETYTKARLPGVATAAKHSYEEVPPLEAFGQLMEEFAKEGARPR
jgi:hypothetical protein